MQFIDRAHIEVKAGDGGNGCQSLNKDLFCPKGRPDGGNGGKGGDIICVADENVMTLMDFSYRSHYKAERGKHGSSKHKTGKNGKDCILKVPCGTRIYDADTNELITDLVQKGQEAVVAKGGKGGLGNMYAREAKPGFHGSKRMLYLELRVIADVGIVGLPNAGKSSLLAAITHAHPKIAAYPFTTLSPVLGRLKVEGQYIILADIPGLIEGASSGKGLGDEFLRHISRTRLFVHVIDGTVDDVIAALNTINNELVQYDKNFAKILQIIVCNKMDLDTAASNFRILKKYLSKKHKKCIGISAETGIGLDELTKELKIALEGI